MRRMQGILVAGLLFACGGPKDPAAAAAAGNWAAVQKFLADPNPTVRAAALAEIIKAPDTKLLASAALDQPNADVYQAALPALLDRAVAGDKDATDSFKKALNSPEALVQVESIKALQKKGAPAAKLFEATFTQLLADPDDPVFAAVTDAIKLLGDDGWPIIKGALSDPLSSMRTKGATVAASMMDLTKKHLDDIAAQFTVEEDEAVLPPLQKILKDAGPASLAPMIRAIQKVTVVSKRADYYDSLGEGITFTVETDPKDPKKKPTQKWMCPAIAAATEDLISAGAAEGDGKLREAPGGYLGNCSGGKQNEGTAESKIIKDALDKTLQDTTADISKRRFSLLVICAYIGTTKEQKDWLKKAQKTETDQKVKDMLKKEGC